MSLSCLVAVDFVAIFESKDTAKGDGNPITHNRQSKSVTDQRSHHRECRQHWSLQTKHTEYF